MKNKMTPYFAILGFIALMLWMLSRIEYEPVMAGPEVDSVRTGSAFLFTGFYDLEVL